VTQQRQKWKEQFGDWFREVLISAKIIDYRYPIKGCGVWLPYGFQLRKLILNVIRHNLDTTNHDEMLFPTLIPEDLIAKESSILHFRQECCIFIFYHSIFYFKVLSYF